MIQRAEVSGFDDFGLAVNALAVTDVIIGMALDGFARKAGHYS